MSQWASDTIAVLHRTIQQIEREYGRDDIHMQDLKRLLLQRIAELEAAHDSDPSQADDKRP